MLLLFSLQDARSQGTTVDQFISSCPSAQEINSFNSDLLLTFEGDPSAGTLVCTAAGGSADLTRLQERTYQALRVMRRHPFSTQLPWTSGNLYDWFVSAIDGVRFRTDIQFSFCCDPPGFINIRANGLTALTTPYWIDPVFHEGLAGLMILLVHEARHNQGFLHTCSANDQTISELGSWGVQYYIEEWLAFYSGSFLNAPAGFPSTNFYHQEHWVRAESTRDFRFCDMGSGVVLTPAGRSFGNQAVAVRSSQEIFAVTATTSTSVAVSIASMGGTNAQDFPAVTQDCQNAVVPPSCLILVGFMPEATGPRSAVLNASTSVPGSPPGSALSGTGTPLVVTINSGGVVNASGFAAAQPVAPGSIAAVFGSNLASFPVLAGAVPLPSMLGGATMNFNGSQAVPKFFASPLQINIQVPWELAGQNQATLTDTLASVTSNSEAVALTAFAPGLFAINQQGTGQGAILIANSAAFAAPAGSIPGASSRPAVRGMDFLEIYWTGGGPVNPAIATGAAAPLTPLSATTTTPTLTIGGVDTPVLFSGLAPNFVGLYVVTCMVPAGAPIGNAVPVVLNIGGVPSNAVTIAVE
ncbi:MAG TPA: hypothetical protein VNN18_04220 [Candidatus Xenobia bacterium]|nr:hypothetical protein [Candidatus Xenobia bacterium]